MASDQCALGPDGTLLDTEDVVFYDDPNDAAPILLFLDQMVEPYMRSLLHVLHQGLWWQDLIVQVMFLIPPSI